MSAVAGEAVADLVAGLDEPAARLPRLAGAKGSALARMTSAGLPVPAGFVVTTSAFDGAAASIPGVLFEEMASAGPTNPAALEKPCEEARRAIARAGVPIEAEAAVKQAYRRLGAPPVSVRSSGTEEDLAGASFAGQYDTFLNVTGEDAVLRAVVAVWASIYSAHAVAYRLQLGMDAGSGKMAVVVQTQLYPEAAGVMFTRNPISGREDRYLVNAALGQGEGVVSGQAPADTFELDSATLEVVSQAIARKDTMLAPAESGVEPAPVPRDRWDLPALTPDQLARLGGYGARLTELNGGPQDIEFAVEGSNVHILQSRPVTDPRQSVPFPVTWDDPEDERYLWARSAGPLLRLEEDNTHVMYEWLKRCFDATGAAYSRKHEYLVLNGYLYTRPAEIDEAELEGIQARYQAKEEAYREEGSSIYAAEIAPRTTQLLAELDAFDPDGASLPQLVRHLESAESANGEVMGWLHWAMASASGGSRDWPETFQELTGESKSASGELLRAVPNKTTLMIGRLRGMARLAKEDEGIAADVSSGDYESLRTQRPGRSGAQRRFLERFRRFLRDYGHHTGWGYGSDTGFATPTWNLEPARVLDIIDSYAGQDLDRLDTQERSARAGRVAAVRRIRRRLAALPDRLAEFNRELAGAQQRDARMENHNHLMEQGVNGAYREAIHHVGAWLAEEGLLDEPNDVFHLSMAELRAMASGQAPGDLRALAASRKAEQEDRRNMRAPSTLGKGTAPLDAHGARYDPPGDAGLQGTILRGVAASPGRAVGRAVVALGGETPPRVRQGDILVAPNAGPAWTPVFPLLGGVVLDGGAVFQHAAVVAREYGIPAIVMTRDGTEVVLDGQTILVDGNSGVADLSPRDVQRAV